jgi:hypothetical protein
MKWFAIAAIAAVTLTGCTATTIDAATPSATATSTPVPTLAPTVAAGFSYADGNDLSTSIKDAPVFANTYSSDSNWKAGATTDADNGYWTYTSADGGCTADISQISIGKNFTITKGDDSKTSDAALKWYFRNTESIADNLTSLVTDAALPYGADWASGDPGAEFRGFTAEGDDGTVVAAYARAFGVPKVALFFDLTCTSTEAFSANSQSALLNSAVLTF